MAENQQAGNGQQQQQPQAGEGAQQGGNEPQAGAQAGDGQQQQQQPQGEFVNRHKHEREVKKLTDEIEDLKSQLAASRQGEGEAAKLREDFENYKAEQASKALEAALSEAGCLNVKAAMALMADADNDVAKVKESAPYLFKSEESNQSTGGTPKGAAGGEDASTARFRKSLGLKD